MTTAVFDSSVLSPFARAGRLDDLRTMFEGMTLVTTSAVREELLNGVGDHPALRTVLDAEWLLTAATDGIQVLLAFVAYRRIFGGCTRDVGEATVLAYAEVHGATAVIDEQVAVKHGRDRGVTVIRTLSPIADCIDQGRFDLGVASPRSPPHTPEDRASPGRAHG